MEEEIAKCYHCRHHPQDQFIFLLLYNQPVCKSDKYLSSLHDRYKIVQCCYFSMCRCILDAVLEVEEVDRAKIGLKNFASVSKDSIIYHCDWQCYCLIF